MRVVKYSQDLPLTNRVTGGLTTFSLAHIGSGPAWFGAALSVGSAGGRRTVPVARVAGTYDELANIGGEIL